MNIFITGDTHGDLSRVLEMYDAITGDTPKGLPHVDKFDYLIHCGDYKKDGFDLGKKLGLPVVTVYGNCDDVWEPDFDIIDTDAGSIVATHGHVEDINNTHEHLYELAEDQGCNCICYGHSHIAMYGEENGYLVINPGSLTKPLDGTMGSVAILKADKNGYAGNLVWYADLIKARTPEEPAPAAPEEPVEDAPVEEEPSEEEPAEEAPVEEPIEEIPAEEEPAEEVPIEEPVEDAPVEEEPKETVEEPEPEPAEPEQTPEEPVEETPVDEEPVEEPEPEPKPAPAPAEPEPKPAPAPAPAPAKKKSGGLGGFLRKIFNWSDGQ